jgi:hypothetical protein
LPAVEAVEEAGEVEGYCPVRKRQCWPVRNQSHKPAGTDMRP